MNTLLKCGAGEHHMEAAHHLMRPLQVDTQCDRSVLTSINQSKADLEFDLYDSGVNIADLMGYRAGAVLNQRLRSIRGGQFFQPVEAMFQLLDALPSNTSPSDEPTPAPHDREPEQQEDLPDKVLYLKNFR